MNNANFVKKSTWNPPPQSSTLEAFIQAVDQDINKFKYDQSKHRDNLSPAERKALNTLRNSTELIIKPADKGSGVVVMDKADYVQKAESQLYDQSAYQKLDTDPTEKYTQKVSDTIKDLQERKIITDTVADYLTPENTTAGRFSTIPKVHKPTIPMRPIVSGNNTATERISEYVDFHLRPLVETTSVLYSGHN